MSGRGGRGGRGRGAKGYVPPSGAQLFLQRSAQECGLDSRNLRALQDVTRPMLFPDLKWHSNGTLWQPETDGESPPPTTVKRSSITTYLIQKQREVHRRMQTSAYYVRASNTQESDVLRYSDWNARKSKKPRSVHDAVLEQMGPDVATADHMPLELLGNEQQKLAILEEQQKNQEASDKLAAAKSLDELEAQESVRRDPNAPTAAATGVNPAVATSTEEDALGNLSDLENNEEEEEGEDYVMNYYASEDESDGGVGDDEPTF